MSTIIKVENLGKSYIIAHEGRERYTALRDVIAGKAKKIFTFNRSKNNHLHSFTKEEYWALRDVNFKVQDGDRVGIIGRNGAGKSTLLKILSRITEPTRGSVKIKGKVASLLEVGTGFHPELTGSENIFLNGAILGMSRTEVKKKFDEIVDFAEVEKFLDTPVKRYSSGMYVRLAFAVAAHLEPEILVVDEVLAVGDAQFQKKCLGKMEDVSKNEGRTILFVSHNMAAVQKLCDRVLVFEKSILLADDFTKKAIEQYLVLGMKQQETSFKNYENDYLVIKSINIVDCNNNTEDFYVNNDVYIQIIVEFKDKLTGIAFEILFKTIEGIEVFNSITNPDNYEKTEYKVNCKIPGNFLNDKEYTFDFGISKNYSFWIFKLDNVLNLKINNVVLEGEWFGNYQGVIRPQLNWNILRKK
jgi:lipopolysaccharide transport system ATP-binding protein